MALTLYWGSGSAFAWRVQLALEFKSLPYESRLLSFSAKETRTPEFLAINPRGKVPVLVDGQCVVRESQAIVHYLDRKYPEPPLFGRTPAQAAAVIQCICEVGSYLEAPLLALARTAFSGQVAARAEELRAQAAKVAAELATSEGELAARPWLADEAPSAADLHLFPLVQTLVRALGKPGVAELAPELVPLPARFPAIGAWMARIQAMPGYERTYPPHWRE